MAAEPDRVRVPLFGDVRRLCQRDVLRLNTPDPAVVIGTEHEAPNRRCRSRSNVRCRDVERTRTIDGAISRAAEVRGKPEQQRSWIASVY